MTTALLDPPAFLLLASPTWSPSTWLPDRASQTVPIGVTGQVLTVQADGSINWQNSAAGFSNPMTAVGDLIEGGTAGLATRLAVGTAGQVLTVVSGSPAWANPVTGFANPMTGTGDLITSTAGGTPVRLPAGTANQALIISGGTPTWSSSVLINPMTTLYDLIVGGVAGAPTRLAGGASGQVLGFTVGGPAWTNLPASFANPMIASQDLIVGGVAGAAGRLAVGASGQVLGVTSGAVGWVNNPAGFANPMTLPQDLIVGGVGGAATRLPVGSSGYVLTVAGGAVSWQPPISGFANPMTALGDLITGASGGSAQRLGVGAAGQVLTMVSGVPAWATTSASLTNPMTTPQDLIVGGTAGAPTRLGAGTAGQVLKIVNGAVAWAQDLGIPLGGPSPTQQTMWLQADGSILVIPLSTYSLVGDDSVWINNAFTFLPTRTQQYGTNTNTWTYGTVELLPQQYTCNTTVNLPAMVNLRGTGSGTELRGGTAAMTVVKWHSAFSDGANTTFARHKMATISGIRISGTNVTGAGVGLDCGDGFGGTIDPSVAIVDFRGAGAIGLIFNNGLFFSEKWNIVCSIMGCTQAALITQTGGTDSMEYNDILLWIENGGAMTNAVVVNNGVFMQGGSLKIRGNMGGSTGSCLTVTGNDGAGGNTSITAQYLEVNMEATTASTTTTITFGSTANSIKNCIGLLSFRFTTFLTAAGLGGGNFNFGGLIQGDTALSGAAATAAGRTAATAPVGWV